MLAIIMKNLTTSPVAIMLRKNMLAILCKHKLHTIGNVKKIALAA